MTPIILYETSESSSLHLRPPLNYFRTVQDWFNALLKCSIIYTVYEMYFSVCVCVCVHACMWVYVQYKLKLQSLCAHNPVDMCRCVYKPHWIELNWNSPFLYTYTSPHQYMDIPSHAFVGKLLHWSLLHLVLLVLQFCAGVPGGRWGTTQRQCNGQGISGLLTWVLAMEGSIHIFLSLLSKYYANSKTWTLQ